MERHRPSHRCKSRIIIQIQPSTSSTTEHPSHSHPTENGPQIYAAFACWNDGNDMNLQAFSTFLSQAAMQLDAICQDARAVLEWLE